jgi:[acyl-carrier-protein] S-malonyltransferase
MRGREAPPVAIGHPAGAMRAGRPVNYAVLCPGQGAQHPGMLDLAAADPAGQDVISRAATALGEDPRDWLGREDAIYRNAIAQPLICVAQLALWSTLRRALDAPLAYAGYSVGELACYGLGDALDAGSLAQLARTRATLMDAAAGREAGGLIAVRGPVRAAIDEACSGARAWIAIAIGRDAFVVGGTLPALAIVRERLSGTGAQITPLRVGVAAHTPLLESAVAGFRRTLEGSALRAPERPVVAGIDATFVTARDRAIATLAAQVAQPVEWAQCVDALHERGCRVFLELGPGAALTRMVRDRHDDVDARSVDEFRDPAAIVEWIRRKTR